MLLDMHCHTKEGSVDAHISVMDYLSNKSQIDGILITDHNSYDGYQVYLQSKVSTGIKVFKGIEYDTCDAGHMIIILPKKAECKYLTLKGMPVRHLIKLVHYYGGVIGSAHPFDYAHLGMGNIKKWSLLKNIDVWHTLDFIEGFNSCGSQITNKLSTALAKQLNKVVTGGSDTHRKISMCLAGTYIDDTPQTEDDLIEIIKQRDNNKINVWGNSKLFERSLNKKHKLICGLGLLGCYTNNKIAYYLNNKFITE